MSTRTPTSGAVRTRTTKAIGAPAPIQLRKRPSAWDEPDRIALFTIDDTEYSMPAVIHQGDAMKWAGALNTIKDDDVKAITLLRYMCGNEAADALLNEAALTKGEWQHLKDRMTLHAFGPAERTESEGN
jgi:hypothetical protein